MSQIRRMFERLAKESNGKIRIVEVPPEKRPTAESLAKLEREIKAQIDANDAMRHRSYINASKHFTKYVLALVVSKL